MIQKLLIILFSLFALSHIAIAQPASERTWGLCIGIAQYDPEQISLKLSDIDAIAFCQSFLKYTLKVPDENYRIIKNNDATRSAILDDFGWLIGQAKPGDRVYIFYSGHGKQYSPILPYDSENWLSLEEIQHRLKKIDAGDIIFFADACYSGRLAGKDAKAAIEQADFTGLDKAMIKKISEASQGLVIITSANGTQLSFEGQFQKKNSIFTEHLLNILIERQQFADTNHDGKLSLYEVYKEVYRAVTNKSKQQPQISDEEKAKRIVLFSYGQPFPTPTAMPTPIPTPISISTPVPTPTPKRTSIPNTPFQLEQIVVRNARKQMIKPQQGIYTIRYGETATITLEVSFSERHKIEIGWETREGWVSHIQGKDFAYSSKKAGRDYIIFYIYNSTTGERIDATLNITVLP